MTLLARRFRSPATASLLGAGAMLAVLLIVPSACGTSAPSTVVTAPTTAASAQDPSPEPSMGTSDSGASEAATTSDGGPANTSTKTLFVKEALVDCEGEGPMQCMQVREGGSDEWVLFYDRIEGFTYEEGYAYELRVAVEPRAKPPADASSLRYRLLEVVTKEKKAKATKKK